MGKQLGYSYTKSFGLSPLSSRILLNNFGCSMRDAWKGTVTRLPSTFLKILWLPDCRTNANPLRSSTAMARAAVMRGNRGMLTLNRHFDRREYHVFRLRDLLISCRHILKVERYRVVDVCERLLIRIALGVASLECWTTGKVSVFVLFYNNGKSIFHNCSYSISRRTLLSMLKSI
jgi:hypothetical protein